MLGAEVVGAVRAHAAAAVGDGRAEHDELAPPDMVKELKALFDKSGNGGELEIQMGVHHGFAFPQRWCYDKLAAERHWERLIALYRRRLG